MAKAPLKVLLVHNFYRTISPSGEDAVYRNEQSLLESNGIQIVRYEIQNDDINDSTFYSKIGIGINTIWSRDTYKRISRIIRDEKPDIAHFHNTFPQVSPSAYAACKRYQVPVIQTLHNFRLICPGALLLRDNKPCEDCLGTSLVPSLKHRCYRDSLAATGTLAATITTNRLIGSYRNNVDYYIALSQFAVSRFIKGGLPVEKLLVKPNFLPVTPEPGDGAGGHVVYTGRISQEKGVVHLLRAWKQVKDVKLLILGDGPDRADLEKYAEENSLNVDFLGFQPSEVIMEKVSNAIFSVLPSLCYEGFPMVILEAMACGTPVLVSDMGSMAELVIDGKNGYTFKPADHDDLAEKALHLINLYKNNEDSYHQLRSQCRSLFEEKYNAKSNLDQLLSIYHRALDQDK